jgi:hypothetical protein
MDDLVEHSWTMATGVRESFLLLTAHSRLSISQAWAMKQTMAVSSLPNVRRPCYG